MIPRKQAAFSSSADTKLRVLAVASYVVGVWCIGLGVFFTVGFAVSENDHGVFVEGLAFIVLVILSVLAGVPVLVAGFVLVQRRPWARTYVRIVSCLAVLVSLPNPFTLPAAGIFAVLAYVLLLRRDGSFPFGRLK